MRSWAVSSCSPGWLTSIGSRSVAVHPDRDPALAVGRRVGAACLVVELRRAGSPSVLDQGSSVEPPGNSSGVGAITFTPATSDGRMGSSSGGHSPLAVPLGERLADLLLGGRVVALAEVVPAQRAALPPEEERGPAVRLVELPERELAVHRDGPVDPEPLGRAGHCVRVLREGKARGVDADHRQAVALVALMPGAEVGQGADRVELGEVEEMDQGRARGGQPVDRLHGLADPVEAAGDRGHGDVGSRGTQAPEGMLLRCRAGAPKEQPRSSKRKEEWFA